MKTLAWSITVAPFLETSRSEASSGLHTHSEEAAALSTELSLLDRAVMKGRKNDHLSVSISL